jgi:hypothetical protein
MHALAPRPTFTRASNGRAYGANSDGWIGKQIQLELGQIQYQGKSQDAAIVKRHPLQRSVVMQEIPLIPRRLRQELEQLRARMPALPGAAMTQLEGLVVRCQQKPCPDCRCVDCLIGMNDELVCLVCDRHRGQLRKRTHAFISESIRNFGRPIEPIQLRINSSASDEVTATSTAVATERDCHGLR